MKQKQNEQKELKTPIFYNFCQVENLRNNLIKNKMPFTLEITNYTTRIKTEAGGDFHFMRKLKKPVFFAAAQKVKADCIKKSMPKIEPESLHFFWMNTGNLKNIINGQTVYCVDINSAYPSALLNTGFITPETFKFLQIIPKVDRLAALGFMASQKDVFYWDENGRLYAFEHIESKTAGYFWYAVHCINKLMLPLMKLMEQQSLFFWVDGFYFLDTNHPYNATAIQKYFQDMGYQSKIEVCENFHCNPKKKHTEFTYTKDGKKKAINIPNRNFDKQMILETIKQENEVL
jgi:hypothetical protein